MNYELAMKEIETTGHKCIVKQLSYADYKRCPGVNISTLKSIDESPEQYVYDLEHPQEETDALIIGNAYHTAALEPEEFKARYCFMECESRKGSKEYKAIYAKVEAENPGKIILKKDDFDMVTEMAARLHSNPVVGPHLKVGTGENELSMFWIDNDTGIKCKGRIDRTTDLFHVDLKSAVSATQREFDRAVRNYLYYVQDAYYSDGYETITGVRKSFLFIPQQKNAPYVPAVYNLDDTYHARGRIKYQAWLMILKRCMEQDYYPGYIDKNDDAPVKTLVAPSWLAFE